jgi:hypothetical protein
LAYRTVGALACLVLLAACGEEKLPVGHYKIGLKEAHERLAKSDWRDFMRERQCGILVHLKASPRLDPAVTWRVSSSGQEMFNFTATLTAVSPTVTKVDISVSKDPEGGEAYDGKHFYKRPALRQPVRPAINEQVAAVMQGRPYNVANAQAPPKDTVCLIQRGGLETGMRFSINDK